MLRNASFVGRLVGTCRLSFTLALAVGLFSVVTANAATITVNGLDNIVDGDTTSLTSLLSTPGSDGKISLPEAITACNNTPGADTVQFDPSLDGAFITTPAVLPEITDPITLDGASLGITLDFDGASGPAAISLGTGSSMSTIRGLKIINAFASGISIGGDSTGNTLSALTLYNNSGHGILIGGQSGAGSNTITGCLIGTDGATDLGNAQDGIHIANSSDNVIGGPSSADRNIISGNSGAGISIEISGSTQSANNNKILNNYIGLGQSGLPVMGNTNYGILVSGVSGDPNAINNTFIGDIGQGNVISGNEIANVRLEGASVTNTRIQGNYIGTSIDGLSSVFVSETSGVVLSFGVSQTKIGGTTEGQGNVISGNDSSGLRIIDSNDNLIEGNKIGLGADGTTPVGNGSDGISISASGSGAVGNIIGGSAAGANVIAHNPGYGVSLVRSTSNVEQTNITYNSIFSNADGGISFFLGTENGGLPAPNIDAINATYPYTVTLSGSFSAGDIIHLYADSTSQGRYFVGKSVLSSGGSTVTIPANIAPFDDLFLTATLSRDPGDGRLNTSPFSLVSTPNAIGTIPPTLILDVASGQADPTNSLPVDFELNADEPITDLDSTDIVNDGTATSLSYAIVPSAGDKHFIIRASEIGTDGTVQLRIPAGAVTDLSANPTTTDSANDTSDGTVLYDATTPVITVTSRVTNDPSPALSGMIDDTGASISVVVDGGSSVTATNNGDGTWNLPSGILSNLADGQYEVEASAFDGLNTGTDSTSLELTIDTVAPTAGMNTLITNDPSPALSGPNFDATATILVTVDSSVELPAVNNGSTWSLASGQITNLAQGHYDVTLDLSDPAGNTNQIVLSGVLIIDLTSPVLTIDTTITSDNTPDLTGTVTDATSTTVQVTAGGQTVNATVDTGVWTATLPNPLADGEYTVDAQATDAGGNVNTESVPAGLVIDTMAPTVSIETFATDDTTPGLSGTVDDGDSARTSDVLIDLIVDGNTYSANNNGDGTWSLAQGAISPPLTDGTYDITATATDSVGNVGNDASTSVLTIDTAAPEVTIDSLMSPSGLPTITGTINDLTTSVVTVTVNSETITANVNGSSWSALVLQPLADGIYDVSATAVDELEHSGSDQTTDELLVDTVAPLVTVDTLETSNVTPTVTGTVEDANLSSLYVVVDGVTYSATVADTAWFADISAGLAPDAVYDVSTTATDSAGNSGTDQTTNELRIDKTAPTITVNTLITSAQPPVVSGTVNDSGSTTVNVDVDGTSYSAEVNAGLWSAVVTDLSSDGIYDVIATATDGAGNVGVDATTDELIFDTTAPEVTVNSLTTNDPTPTLSGTITDLTQASVVVTINGTSYTALVEGSTWTADVTVALPDGTYDVQAIATDRVELMGNDVTSDEVIVLASAPSVSVESLITKNTSPQLTGTASGGFPIASVEVTVNGTVYSATVTEPSWSVTIGEVLAEGSYDVTVKATDTNGTDGLETFPKALTIDLTAPVITVNTLITNTATPTISGTIDAVTSGFLLHVTIADQNYTFTSPSANWSFTTEGPLADGTYDVQATAVDEAGNSGSDITSDELVIDTVAPSAVALSPEGNSLTNADSVDFTLLFDEPVEGLDKSDFTVIVDGVPQKNGPPKTLGGLPLDITISGTDNQYTITVQTGSGDGTIALRLENDASITDAAGNPIGSILDSESGFTIDRTPPTVQITSKANNPTAESPIPFTVTFSELISGFSPDEVSLTNAIVDAFEGDGLVFEGTLLPSGEGEVTLTVNPNAVQDGAGNGNVEGTVFSINYLPGGEGEGEGENCVSGCSDDTTDGDGDGLSPCIEQCIGTRDDKIDSDGDGMADNFEFKYGLNPRRFDSDGDKDGDDLSNLEEFLNNSDPMDATDPDETYFVAIEGSDETGDGSLVNPFRTISRGLEQRRSRSDRDVRLVIGAGTYEEDVVMRPRFIIAAQTGAEVIIVGQVTGANRSAIRRVTIMAGEGDTYLFDMNNVAMAVTEVNFLGSESRDMTGMLVDGSLPAGSVIDLCRFSSLGVGIDIANAIPTIRRCIFENIPKTFGSPPSRGCGIILRALVGSNVQGENQSLGDTTDPGTGWNDFLTSVEGLAVINERDTEILMQDNYWGFTEPEDFNMRVDGPAVLEPVLAQSSAVLAASIFCTVWNDTDQKRLGTAEIDLNISSFKSVTKNTDGVYAFPAISEGQYTIVVNAAGFQRKSVQVDVAGGELKSVTIALRASDAGEGGGGGCPASANAAKAVSDYASDIFLGGLTMLAMAVLGRRYRRRYE